MYRKHEAGTWGVEVITALISECHLCYLTAARAADCAGSAEVEQAHAC
jgi:hypothetical protein